MTHVLILGAARSGTAVVQQAVAAAVGVSPISMATQFGLLHCFEQTMRSHSNAFGRAKPSEPSGIETMRILSLFWKMLLKEQQQGIEHTDVVLGASEILPDCPNLKSARTLMTLEPDWCAIAVQRHPVDFVNSRLRAHSQTTFATHCSLWSNSSHQIRKLKKTFGSRVLVLDHATLLASPDVVGATITAFLHLVRDAGQVMARMLAESRPGRTSTFLHDSVRRLADTNWSPGEISLFRLLCEEPAAAAGYVLDFDGVEQARPLDLVHAVQERALFTGTWLAHALDLGEKTAQIRCGGAGATGGSLRLGPVNVGGRRRLRLLFVPAIGDHERALQFDIIESLSRRPVFRHIFVLAHDKEVALDTSLPPHDGLLDLVFSGLDARAPLAFQIRYASLSHA